MFAHAPHAELTIALQTAGLSEKEARVYLAALELGSATALTLSRKTGISRATLYLASERLIERGLMSSFDEGGKRHFASEPPSRLLHHLETEAATLNDRKQTIAHALPTLEALLKTDGVRPVVRYYEGLHGLEAMREILYQNRRYEVLSAIDADQYVNVLPPEDQVRHHERLQHYSVRSRVLYTCTDATLARIATRIASSPTYEYRRIPRERFLFPAEMVTFGNIVALFSYEGGMSGCVIEQPEFAKTMQSFFELAWSNVKSA